MSRPAPTLDSLDMVELVMSLEESKLLTAAQLDLLGPFLVAPFRVKWIRGGIESRGSVIAQVPGAVLFVDEGGATLGVGILVEVRTVRDPKIHVSAEMAIRTFLGKAAEPHDI